MAYIGFRFNENNEKNGEITTYTTTTMFFFILINF